MKKLMQAIKSWWVRSPRLDQEEDSKAQNLKAASFYGDWRQPPLGAVRPERSY